MFLVRVSVRFAGGRSISVMPYAIDAHTITITALRAKNSFVSSFPETFAFMLN